MKRRDETQKGGGGKGKRRRKRTILSVPSGLGYQEHHCRFERLTAPGEGKEPLTWTRTILRKNAYEYKEMGKTQEPTRLMRWDAPTKTE